MALCLSSEGRCRRVGAGSQFFVDHEQAVAVAVEHTQIVEDVAHVVFFLHLFVDKTI